MHLQPFHSPLSLVLKSVLLLQDVVAAACEVFHVGSKSIDLNGIVQHINTYASTPSTTDTSLYASIPLPPQLQLVLIPILTPTSQISSTFHHCIFPHHHMFADPISNLRPTPYPVSRITEPHPSGAGWMPWTRPTHRRGTLCIIVNTMRLLAGRCKQSSIDQPLSEERFANWSG